MGEGTKIEWAHDAHAGTHTLCVGQVRLVARYVELLDDEPLYSCRIEDIAGLWSMDVGEARGAENAKELLTIDGPRWMASAAQAIKEASP